MIAAALTFLVFLGLSLWLLHKLPRDTHHVPDDVMARIDAVLPRSQEEERWLKNHDDLVQ
jgi:hypothetical protein